VHVDVATDWLARLSSGGICTCCAHQPGYNNQFHGLLPTSKVSGFPWHEQAFVRFGSPRDVLLRGPLGFSPPLEPAIERRREPLIVCDHQLASRHD
jgi:hypothetical protein